MPKLVVAFLLLKTLLAIADPALAADESIRDRGIIATGTCLKKVIQDRGKVTLTTSVLAPTASESSKQASKQNESVRSAIKALNLENVTLETTGFNLGEEREYQGKKVISKGFRSRISLSVETSEISRLGDVLGVASKLGVKEVDGLSTFVSPQKMKLEYESCLETATHNARDKAEKLAKGAGVKLGKVIGIQEGSEQPYHRFESKTMMSEMAMDAAAAAPAPTPTIDTKAEDITVSAVVRFSVD